MDVGEKWHQFSIAAGLLRLHMPGTPFTNINLVLDEIRTFGTSDQAIYCNLQNICFSSLIVNRFRYNENNDKIIPHHRPVVYLIVA